MESEKKNRVRKLILLTLGITIACLAIYIFQIPCAIKRFFGVYCAACGTQRMLTSAVNLDFAQAFKYNPLMFCLTPIVAILYIVESVKYYKTGEILKSRFIKFTIAIIVIISLIFMVLRNMDKFSFLAPNL